MSFTKQYKFPFGKLISKQDTGISTRRDLFILGAYPSALHVRWEPPTPFKPVRALAVDNEPSVFWTGEDQGKLIDAWKEQVGWKNEYGAVSIAGKYNGSSGLWVNDRILMPLGLKRTDVWFSDCLDIYHSSKGQEKRLLDTYNPFSEEFDIDRAYLPQHPDEDDIVREALAYHLDRIEAQLLLAKPNLIVTLGNAALRVIKNLVTSDSVIPDQLVHELVNYGNQIEVLIPGNIKAMWLPLVHPGAPKKYQVVHEKWIETKSKL